MVLGFIFGFLSGIGLSSLFEIGLVVSVFIAILGLLFFVYRFFVEESKRKVLNILTIFTLGVLIGVLRINFSNLYTESQLNDFALQKVEATGIIVDEPDVREHNTKLTVKLSEIQGKKVSEKILVNVPIYPEYHYGDKISGIFTLKVPKDIESDDGRVFDYVGYLRVRGIWYTATYPKIVFVEGGHGSLIKTYLFKIKRAFVDAIDNALPQPESSLLTGLLLGNKQTLGQDLLKEFQRTGTSHVVVLSGYNIAIVATSIMALLSFLPKSFSFFGGAISIILFTILSGGGASAWRASIMVLVALFGKRMKREYKPSRAFGFAVVLMLAPNPLLLVFDPSFQLSVLATIGIIFVSPILEPYFVKIPEKFGLREVITATIATQTTVLPFLIYNTGILSLVSLPVNILILGTIPLTMFLGFFVGAFGIISLYLSFIPALFTYFLLWYQLVVVNLGSSLSFGSINLPSFSPIFVLLAYVLVFFLLYKLRNQAKI